MIHREFDGIRYEAWCDLLALPDPPEMRRGHHVTCQGAPDRHLQLLTILRVWVEQRCLDRTGEEMPAKARTAKRRRQRPQQPTIPFVKRA